MTYLSFQFQMSKKEREICDFKMDLKNFFCLRSNLRNDNIICLKARSENGYGFWRSSLKTHLGEGGGGRWLMAMFHWMESHFHDWTDYNGVAFSVKLLERTKTQTERRLSLRIVQLSLTFPPLSEKI